MSLEQANNIFNIIGNFAVAGALVATIVNSKAQERRFKEQIKVQREQWLNDAYIKAEAAFWIEFKDKLLKFKDVVSRICQIVYIDEEEPFLLLETNPIDLLKKFEVTIKDFESLIKTNKAYFDRNEEMLSILEYTISCFQCIVITFLKLCPGLYWSCFIDSYVKEVDKHYYSLASGKKLRSKFFSSCIFNLLNCKYYKPFFVEYINLVNNDEELEKITSDNNIFSEKMDCITSKIDKIIDTTNSIIKFKY